MSNLYPFHQTTIGHRHIKDGTPCEDASLSFYDESLGCAVAAVADGHGSSIYARSRFGSEFAVNAAKDVFTAFAEKYKDKPASLTELFSDETAKKQTVRRITDSILEHWLAAVDAHLQENPVTEEELSGMPEKFADMFRHEVDMPTLYGTTLMAALWLHDYLILVHQGDGRCAVFYADGSFNQPIPWDKLCYDTFTTSLCEDSAAERFRSHVIDLREEPVAACFLGTDGVEDSFKSMEDMHIFYMQLCRLILEKPATFVDGLAKTLPKLTKTGSQDDISIAGIADTKQLESNIRGFMRYVVNRTKKVQVDKVQQKLDMMKPVHERNKEDLHYCELAVLEQTAAKLKAGEPLTRGNLEKILLKADKRLTETCFDCIDARIVFESYHKRYLEILEQQKKENK